MTSRNQTNSVFALLPEEGWLLAFKKLTNPADLYACFEASTEWKNILLSEKSLIATLLFYKCLPLLYKYLSLVDFLNSRLVSKQWKYGLDSFLKQVQTNLPVSSDKFLCVLGLQFFPLTHSRKVKLDLTKNANLTVFPRTIAQFQLQTSNFKKVPSNLHTVCVSDFYRLDGEKLSQDLLPFFQKFGIYIKHLCLHLKLVPAASFLVYLQTLLENTPNLKSLAITECLNGGLSVPIKISKESKLPALPQLQLLELDAQNLDIRRFVLQALLVKNSENLVNLSVVSVSIYSKHELLILQSVSFAVTELHLTIVQADVSLAEILKTTEHFKHSLKILKQSLLNVDLVNSFVFKNMDLRELQRLTTHSLGSFGGNSNKVYILFQARLCCTLWTRFTDLKQVRIIGLDGSIKVVCRPSFDIYGLGGLHLLSIDGKTGRETGRMSIGIRRRLRSVRSYLTSLCTSMLHFFAIRRVNY